MLVLPIRIRLSVDQESDDFIVALRVEYCRPQRRVSMLVIDVNVCATRQDAMYRIVVLYRDA